MSTNNEKALLSPQQIEALDVLKKNIPIDRQLSWLQLSNLKLSTEGKLEMKILNVQTILNGYEKMELIQLQKAVEDAKLIINTDIPETRKSFTRYLDKIFDSLMEVEKRAKSLDIFAKATQRELDLRLLKEKKDTDTKLKADEAARFKAHAQNEYIRVSTDYELLLNQMVNSSYISALNQELTDDGLRSHIDKLVVSLNEVKPLVGVKFNYTLHSREEMLEINKTIPIPDYTLILSKVVSAVTNKFALYYQDRQNAALASEQSKKELEATQRSLEKQSTNSQAVNNLISKGAAALVDTLPGAKKVKRKFVIEIVESPEYATKIIAEFLAHFDEVAPKLKIKTWANLSVKQMAAALQELDEQLPGFKYTEIVK